MDKETVGLGQEWTDKLLIKIKTGNLPLNLLKCWRGHCMTYLIYGILKDGSFELLTSWSYSGFVLFAEALREFGIEIHDAFPVYLATFIEEALPSILERYDYYRRKQREFAEKLSQIIDKLEDEFDKAKAKTLIDFINKGFVIGFFG